VKNFREDASLGPLQDGNRVIIIGGGPSGVSCALALHHIAAQLGRRVNITIIENKDFAIERQHNQCVGVLSPPVASLIEEKLCIPFPIQLKRELVQGYILHTGKEQIVLDEIGEHSIALRRVQFDAYMLDSVKQFGIQVIPTRFVDLEFFHDQVVVYTESLPIRGDVVVGAWGMDDGSAALFQRVTGYRSPQALYSVVTKYHPGEESMRRFGSYIHAFLPRHKRIEFGGITPKGNHLTINIAGKNVDSDLMNEFLDKPYVRSVLPQNTLEEKHDPTDLMFFKGRFPCSTAKRYFGDRYVIVGDAAGLVRAFKGKGITSAVLTGIRAAETIMHYGISETCFAYHYYRANQDIIRDYPYGRLMRFFTILMSRLQLLDPVIRAAQKDQNLHTALLDAVSAHDSYRNVLSRVMKPRSLNRILLEMGRSYLIPTSTTSNKIE
jgi:flavin-dependent dehydrogenase